MFNNPLGSSPGTWAGLRIIEDDTMVDITEDWSRVRSPGRAARRRRYGHPQRIVLTGVPKKTAIQVGNILRMHPAMVAELRRLTREGA